MSARSHLLLLLVIVVAVGATVYMLLGEGFSDERDTLTRGTGDGGPEHGLIDLSDPSLAGAPGAMSAEERAAIERARADAAAQPAFPRSQGVYGRVTDAGGRPVANAEVKLMTPPEVYRRWGVPDPPALATALTNAAGDYVVGPAPDGRLKVRAQAAGYAPTVKLVNRRGYRVDLILDRGCALYVTVKAAAGDAIPEARVLHQADDVVTDALTDEEGQAFFPGLPTGTGTLFVSADEYAGIQQNEVGLPPGKTERMTVVLGKPLIVEGRVIEGETERPVENAKVTIRYPYMPWIKKTEPVKTDEGGAFEMEVPLPIGQSMDVQIEAAGFATNRAWYQATDAGGGRMTLEFKLGPAGGSLRGEVVDARGRAVAGARVVYVSRQPGQEVPETTTRNDGTFVLPPTPWSNRPGVQMQIGAIAPSGAVGVGYARVPKEGEREDPVTIRLSGAGRIQGRVTSGEGEPVAGALVALAVDWNATVRRPSGPGGGSPWMVASLLQNPQFANLDAVTDDTGHYELMSVPVAAYRVTAAFGLETAAADEVAEIEPGAALTRDLVLGSGGVLAGIVLDPEGLPVAGARVTAWPEQNRRVYHPGGWSSARSQSDGRFTLRGLSEDNHTVRARAAGYESESVRGVTPGSGDVTLTLTPLGWIEGVVSHEGRPLQGTFTVRARPFVDTADAARPEMRGPYRGGSSQNTFHTDDGRFVLRNLRGGEYDVSAQTPDGMISQGYVRVRVANGRAARAQLSVVGGAVLSGVLVDDMSGEPIAGASVNIQGSPGPDTPPARAYSRTDAAGRFEARGLATGRYVVNVHPPSGIPFHESLDIQAGERREITLRERATGQLRIYVRDTDRRPLEGATPRVKGGAGMEIWPSWQALRREGVELGRGTAWATVLRTDASGANLRRHIPPGRYEVYADLGGYRTVESVWVEVRSGRVSEVEVLLERTESGQPPR